MNAQAEPTTSRASTGTSNRDPTCEVRVQWRDKENRRVGWWRRRGLKCNEDRARMKMGCGGIPEYGPYSPTAPAPRITYRSLPYERLLRLHSPYRLTYLLTRAIGDLADQPADALNRPTYQPT